MLIPNVVNWIDLNNISPYFASFQRAVNDKLGGDLLKKKDIYENILKKIKNL